MTRATDPAHSFMFAMKQNSGRWEAEHGVTVDAYTSSDNNKFFALDTPFAKEERRTHLMLILLSPLTEITFLNLLILSLIINGSGISN